MEITSAEFVISNTDVKKCPAGIFPEGPPQLGVGGPPVVKVWP